MQIGEYNLNSPESIDTPAFLVYEDKVKFNVEEVVRVCGSADRVVPHAKTHKSSDVLKLQMAGGLMAYKCATLREAEMLAENGVKEITISYPLLHPLKIERFFSLKKQHPEIEMRLIAGTSEHLATYSEAAQANGVEVGIYMDLDTGMRRTGVQPGSDAGDFYAQIASTPSLNPLGVHVFDGHTLYKPDKAERQALVDQSIEYMHDAWDRAATRGIDVVDNLAGGSWSFHLYLGENNVRVSAGTWVYWDSRNATIPELDFKIAAVVLGQVVDRDPEMDTVTTDVGSKSCAPDQPMDVRFKVAGHPNSVLSAQSEEHGVIKLNGESLDVGEYILAEPGHACTTTVKYPHALVVNSAGDVVDKYNHDARDR